MATIQSDDSTNDWIAIAIITVGALLLRLYGLNVQSLWSDESFSMLASTQSFTVMMQQLQQDFVHPPLYYIILHWVHNLFGLDVFTARAVSVFFGTLSVPVLYLAGKYLFNRRTGLVAAILLTLSQLGVMYSQEARDYALQIFFIVTTLYFLGQLGGRNKSWAWWPFVLSVVAAVYTHYYSLFVVGPLLLWAAYGAFQTNTVSRLQIALGLLFLPLSQVPWLASGIIDIAAAHPKTIPLEQPGWFDINWSTFFNTINKFNNGSLTNLLPPGPNWSYAIGACLFIVPLFAIRLRSAESRRDFTAGAWLIATLAVAVIALMTNSGTSGAAAVTLFAGKTILEFMRPASIGSTTVFKWVSAPAAWAIVTLLAMPIAVYRNAPGWVLFVLGILFSLIAYEFLRGRHVRIRPAHKDDGLQAMVFLLTATLGVVIPILLGVFGIQYAPRYSLAALPLYYLLVAYGLMQVESSWLRRLAIGAICAYSTIALSANYLSGYKENWRDSMALMIENYQAGDCVVTPPWDILPKTWYAYGYDKQLPQMRFLPAQDMQAELPTCPRIWVLQYSRVQGVVDRGRPFVELVAQSFDPQQSWSFHWVGVTLYGRSSALNIARRESIADPSAEPNYD